MQTKSRIGGKGFSSKSKFLLDQDQAQTLENFLVTSGTRKRRQQYNRWKYEKFASNAVRLIGTHKKSWVLIKDSINTSFNSFGSAQSSTIEIRFRLHGVGGLCNKFPLYLANRNIHGTGFTFDLRLETAGTPIDLYTPTLIISDGTGTYTTNFGTTLIEYNTWYTLTIVKDNASSLFKCYINGVFAQDSAFIGTPAGAQGVYGTTRTDSTYADIVIGAKTDFTDFSPIDVQEFRVWNEARSAANILAYYKTKLLSTERTNLICYANFQENHNGAYSSELINTNNLIFFSGQSAIKNSDSDYLIFDGSSMYGQFSPIGVGTTYNYWSGLGTATARGILALSEVAFTVCKLKECSIIGGLQLYYDGGTGKYGIRYKYTNNAATTYLSSGGFINNSDLNSTVFYVAIRNKYPAATTLELWINGTKYATVNPTGTWGDIAGEPGKYVGCAYGGTTGFSCVKIKWIRTQNKQVNDSYLQTTKYNQEMTDSDLTTFSIGTAEFEWDNGAPYNRKFTGNSTNLPASLAGGNDLYYFLTKENRDGYPRENYQEGVINFNAGTQVGNLTYGDNTGDPWAAGHTLIGHKQGFLITSLQQRYNVDSFNNIKIDKDTFSKCCSNNSKVAGGYDRDGDNAFKMFLYYYANSTAQTIDQLPSFIAGDMFVTTLKPVRYLGAFKSTDGVIDVIICIIGTGIYVFNRTTKVLTNYNVNIFPNNDAPFVGDFLNGELYLTDGKTKLHIYTYKKQLRVAKWGFERGAIPTLSTYTGGGPWSATLEYAYCYYNREIDQFGPLNFAESDGTGPRIAPAANYAVKLDGITPSYDYFEGVTDIAIFRTKHIGGSGIVGHYWLYDFFLGNSEGAMDWSQADTLLSQRYPIEFSQTTYSNKPPDGTFLISHNKRIWVADGDLIRYSRIGSELHTGVVKPETYTYLSNAFITISGNRPLTGGASFSDKMLFLFTTNTMDVITGSDEYDFEVRRLHEGIGCINHRTIVKYGETLIWLGSDDIYFFKEGIPRPFDQEGKISEYIKNTLDSTKFNKAFAVLNRGRMLYELHVTRTDGIQVTICLDLKTGEFSILKDINASYGCEVLDSNKLPKVFYGTNYGLIVNEDSSGLNYQPPSGSLSTTVSSYSNPTITVAANDLYTTDAGLIGNTVYIVKASGTNEGSVIRALITGNTATTITHDTTDYEVIFGNSFTPSNGDYVYIGPIFVKWKGPVHLNSAVQEDVLKPPEQASDINASELTAVSIIHNRGNSTGKSYMSLYRDGESTLSKIIKIENLDKDFSYQHVIDTSNARFFELELYHVHSSAEFEFIGHGLEFNILRDHDGTH